MRTAEQNYRLLQEIDANRRFMLLAYQSNPSLLAGAEEVIRRLFDSMPDMDTSPEANSQRAQRNPWPTR